LKMLGMKRSRPTDESLGLRRKLQRLDSGQIPSPSLSLSVPETSFGLGFGRPSSNNDNETQNLNGFETSLASNNNINNKYGVCNPSSGLSRSREHQQSDFNSNVSSGLSSSNERSVSPGFGSGVSSDREKEEKEKIDKLVAQTLRLQAEKLQSAQQQLEFKNGQIRDLEHEVLRLRNCDSENVKLKEMNRQLQFLIQCHSRGPSGSPPMFNNDFFNPPDIF